MCNVASDVMAKLEKTVRQFLDEGRMFTGYDVTLETRQREQIKLHHRDVRGAVHEIQVLNDAVDFGYDLNGQTVQWAKTQISMGSSQWAFVYHPVGTDPNGYQPRNTASQAAAAPSAPAASPSAAASPAADEDEEEAKDSGGQNSDGTFSTDYRNRLLIATRFVRGLGLQAGDLISVLADPAKQTVTLVNDPTPQSNGAVHSTQRVERNGDLRLASATLRSANLTCAKFKIEPTTVPATSGVASNVVEIFAA